MAFVKDMIRMWLRSWKRFVSIAMITLLGVAVLTGIYAGCRDAFLASDRFFDAQGMHDIQVLSTAGLSDADVTALRPDTTRPERVSPASSVSCSSVNHRPLVGVCKHSRSLVRQANAG